MVALFSTAIALYRLLFRKPRPGPRNLRFVGACTVWYPTGVPARSAFKLLRHCSVVALPPLALVAVGPEWEPEPDPMILLGIVLGTLLLILTLPVVLPLLAFGVVRPVSVREDAHGVTVRLISTGYSEVELLVGEGAEVSGIKVIDSWELGFRDPPEGFEDTGLRFVVGYLRPGVRRVEVRGTGFAFLRTRGFCLLHASDLPEDRSEVFEWCRWLERFCMAYAALRVDEDVPPEFREVKWLVEDLKANAWSSAGYVVRCLGVDLPLAAYCKSSADLLVAAFVVSFLLSIVLEPSSRGARPMILIPTLVSIQLLASALLTRRHTQYNRQVVSSGRIWRMVTRRYLAQRKVDEI
ncbi:hypothetical protein [Methanopyrus kandleri]